MAQFETTNTFVDGDMVNAASLNNIIDQASALPGLITSHLPAVAAAAGDLVLLSRSSALICSNIATLPQGVTSIGLTADSPLTVSGPPTITATGNWAIRWNAQAANKVLAGPVSGTAAAPTFRELDITDYVKPTVQIALFDIDWSQGSVFSKGLVAPSPFSFSHPTDGQTIRVRLIQNASWSVTFPPAVRWPGGTAPTMTTGAGKHDVFEFTYIVTAGTGTYYGKAYQNYT